MPSLCQVHPTYISYLISAAVLWGHGCWDSEWTGQAKPLFWGTLSARPSSLACASTCSGIPWGLRDCTHRWLADRSSFRHPPFWITNIKRKDKRYFCCLGFFFLRLGKDQMKWVMWKNISVNQGFSKIKSQYSGIWFYFNRSYPSFFVSRFLQSGVFLLF